MSDPAAPPPREPGPATHQDAIRSLLDREAPTEYLEAWRASLQSSAYARVRRHDRETVLFRLGDQWLALDMGSLVEVHDWVPVRSVPARTNEVFRGLVSVRGELHLCADLHALLGVDREESDPKARRSPCSKLLVLDDDGDRWTCEVDAVRGVEGYARRDVLAPQVTVAKSLVHYTDGMIRFSEILAARLAADRLFEGFRGSLGT